MLGLSVIIERQTGEVEAYLANRVTNYALPDDGLLLDFYDSNGCYTIGTALDDDDGITISPIYINDDDINDREKRIKKYDDVWAFLSDDRSDNDVRGI